MRVSKIGKMRTLLVVEKYIVRNWIFFSKIFDLFLLFATTTLLTLMPSHLETALKGRRARSVLIDLKAGISAAPSHMAAKFINDNYKL